MQFEAQPDDMSNIRFSDVPDFTVGSVRSGSRPEVVQNTTWQMDAGYE